MLTETIYELCAKDKNLRRFLIAKGFDNFRNDHDFNTFAKLIDLQSALKVKNIEANLFLEEYKKHKERLNLSDDKSATYRIKGFVPCPVKIPVEEMLREEIARNNLDLSFDFESANLPIDSLYNDLRTGNYPDLITTIGYKLALDDEIREIIGREYIAPDLPYHPNLQKMGIDLRDPRNSFHILGLVPAIFVYNKEKCPNPPESWKDLLSGNYARCLAIPITDLDLYDALLLTIYHKFGISGLENFKQTFRESLHPAQMLKSKTLELAVMPYFFASMIDEKRLAYLWPTDGAIVSPLFLTVKREKADELKPVLDLFISEEFSKKISADGKFPATSLHAVNNLPGNSKFMFATWDVVYQKNITEALEEYAADKFGDDNRQTQ